MDWEERDLTEFINHIPCSSLSYQEWVNVGMALKHEGYPCSVWEGWSRSDNRFKEGECEKKWQTFNGSADPVTGGTIIQLAKDWGYDPTKNDELLDWDDYIGVDKYDMGWVEPDPVEEVDNLNPYEQITTYLSTLFDLDEKACIVMKSFKDEDGKYKPSGKGSTRTVKELLEDLKKHKTDIGAALGDYDENAGAWVRFNPMDGKGVKNDNVTAYKYALVESDEIPIDMQNALIRKMKLPVAILVNSGGKSIHAVVKVSAVNHNIYMKRIEKLYAICDKYGLKVDRANKNASRLSRLPGIKRGDKWQHIIPYNEGFDTFEEWEQWIDGEMDELPDVESIFTDEELPQEKELIEGVLREGRKLLITGPSKIGKSMLLMELGLDLALGEDWLSLKCEKSKVLYIDCELTRIEFQRRMMRIAQAKGIPWDKLKESFFNDMQVWHLRGVQLGDKSDRDKSVYLRTFFSKMIRRIRNGGFNVVIIDPIYKILRGDESDAGFVIEFCNHLDRIYKETGAATIFCHHNVKGSGSRDAIDRSSGTGVFARDPDAIIDFAQLELKDADGCLLDMPDGATAWRAEFILREYREPAPLDLIYEYPLHIIKEGGFGDAVVKGTGRVQRKEWSQKCSDNGINKIKNQATERRESMENAFDALSENGEPLELHTFIDYFRDASGELPYGYSVRTINDVLKSGETKLYIMEKSGRKYVTC